MTRGATEAMQNLIVNYNRLQPGDSVLYADLDYDSMQFAMEWLKDRRGVGVFKIALPEPATRQAILDAYAKAISETPKLRLILLTHLSHRTGLVIPVKEIAAMARERNIDVILDAAHSWGQLEFDIADLGVDFIGFNLHKWIGAPVGLGFLYIRKGRLDINRPALWRRQFRSERHPDARSYRNLELCCDLDASSCAEVSRGHRHTGQGGTSALSARSVGRKGPRVAKRRGSDAGRAGARCWNHLIPPQEQRIARGQQCVGCSLARQAQGSHGAPRRRSQRAVHSCQPRALHDRGGSRSLCRRSRGRDAYGLRLRFPPSSRPAGIAAPNNAT